VARVAEGRGAPRAQVALAWLAQRDVVTAPIVGVTKLRHIDDAVASLKLELTADEMAALEAPYVAHPVAGFN
jgi:aryl-alcohol dehydrogenase-like predicted oxidoreductase